MKSAYRQSRPSHRRLLVALTLVAATAAVAQPSPRSATPAAIRSLSEAPESQGLQVVTSGTVVSSLPGHDAIFLLQKTAGALVKLNGATAPENGTKVVISGHIIVGDVAHLAADKISLQGKGTPSAARPFRAADHPSNADPYRWRSFRGVVHSTTRNQTGWLLEATANGKPFKIATLRRGSAVTSYVTDALMQFQGVTLPGNAVGGSPDETVLWVDDWSRIQRLRKPPARPFSISSTPIADVVNLKPDDLPPGLVRLRGRAESDSAPFRLADDTGVIQITPAIDAEPVSRGDLIDALGYLTVETGGNTMVGARLRQLADGTSASNPGPDAPLESIPWDSLTPLLRTTKEVRSLWDSQSNLKLRAHLTGIVTWAQSNATHVYISQDDEGLRIDAPDTNATLSPGDVITVVGSVHLTETGPALTNATLTKLGREDLPKPVRISATSLVAGTHNLDLIAIEGVVRRLESTPRGVRLKLAYAGRIFYAEAPPTSEIPGRLIDTRVRISGVATTRFAVSERPGETVVLMNGLDDLTVDSRGSDSPFEEPTATIQDLKSIRGNARVTRRNRLEATVTLAWRDRLYLSDATGWIEARLTDSTSTFSMGDKINLLGFIQAARRGIRLEDATATLLRPGPPPPARETSTADLLADKPNGERVSLPGTVLNVSRNQSHFSILLSDAGQRFTAILPATALDMGPPEKLRPGAIYNVTGISVPRQSEDWDNAYLEILLNDAADLELVHAAPRYSPETLLMVIGGLIVVLTAAFAWGALQRLRAARTEARFARAIEASPIPVTIVERSEFRLLESNASFLQLFKLRREEILGRTLSELKLSPAGEQLSRFHADLKQKGAVRTLQCSISDKDGAGVETLITAEPIQFEGVDCLLFIYQDVTEHLQLMNQLRESQKLEAVGRLAAGIAHDFNNLITIVQGNHELLKLGIPHNEENDSLLNSSKAASQRIAELTRQLLTFSRKQVIRRAPTRLDELVQHAASAPLDILGDNITVSRKLHAGDLQLRSDANMMNQMFEHLARNAREAMPDGGEYSIETDEAVFTEDNLPDEQDAVVGRFGKLVVSDTGVGMDRNTLSRAFEPFFTTKDVGQGSGLGLSTVFGIVKQHGGWISATSAPGKGTRFEIFLPAVDESES